MLYAVGTHIDFRKDEKPASAGQVIDRLCEPGTKYTFLKTLSGFNVLNITPPAFAIQVRVAT